MGYYWIWILIWGLVWGAICQAVGEEKNITGFWWGFFLGFIGLIVVLCSNDERQALNINASRQQLVYQCDNCGEIIRENDTFCANCGEEFESDAKITDKYEELNKLKDLLDKGIITKSEFNEEKKKILED